MRIKTLEERLELYVTETGRNDVSSNKLLLAASAVAGVGAILIPPPAEAAIVYSGVLQENNKITAESPSNIVDFDGNAEFKFELDSFIQKINIEASGTMKVIENPGDAPMLPVNLPANYTISSGKSFFNNLNTSNVILAGDTSGGIGNFLNNTGFLGVKFEIENTTHYGWIQYRTNEDASVGTIIDWAYENTSSKAIKTGDKRSFNWNLFLPAIISGNSE